MVSKTYTFSLAVSLIGLFIPCRSLAQETGTCVQGNAQNYLEINNVRARILNNGNLFWDGDPNEYTIPKNSKDQMVFVGDLWLAGWVNQELRAAAARYSNWEFSPGPIPADGSPPTDCSPYDRIWRISKSDIDQYNQTKQTSPDLANWPYQLGAPVLDGDGNPQNYNLAGGDRPALMGTQMLWWVMNDQGQAHQSTRSKPLGVEVRVTAFAFRTSALNPLNTTTFYRYQITNRNSYPIKDLYTSLFMDFDVGDNVYNDLCGTDSLLNMGFSYSPPSSWSKDYQSIGVMLVKGVQPSLPNQTDLYASNLWTEGISDFHSDPSGSALAYYNVMQGKANNGEVVREGAERGYGKGKITRFTYAGNPVTKEGWSSENVDGKGTKAPQGEHRNLITAKPFDLAPNETQELIFALVWAKGETQNQAILGLKQAGSYTQAIAEAIQSPESLRALAPTPSSNTSYNISYAPTTRIAVLGNPYPNPAQKETAFPIHVFIETTVSAKVYDRLGRQVKTLNLGSRSVGLHELRIPTQDLPNGVYHLKMQAGWFTEARPFVVQH